MDNEKITQSEEQCKHSAINPLYELLRADGSIIANKALIHAIGLNEAILFAELISRFNYFADRGQLTDDGYFFNTINDLEAGTGLTWKQQKKALNKLEDMRLIYTRLQGMPAKRYFKIADNLNVLSKYLRAGKVKMRELKPEKPENIQFRQKGETSFAKRENQVSPKGSTNNTNSNYTNEAEAGEPSAALSINNQKAKAVVKVYTDQLKNKGMVPVHNEQKMIKQFADSPLAAEPEKQVVGKMKSWFKTADPYTVGQGYPLGLFIKDYNSIEKPPRIYAGECAECSGPLYEDEDHTCKHNVLCDKCDVVIEYWGEKRDAEILQEHQCDPETLKYRQSFEPVDPEGMRRRKLQEAEEKKWKGVRRIES